MADLTEAQKKAVEKAKARRKEREEKRQEVPTQRLRSIGQGLTFGFADEIEAGIRSLGSREYDDLLNEVRGAVKEYQQARPMEALGYEVGGAALPAIIGSLFTGGGAGAASAASIASRFPTIAKVAGVAAPTSIKQAVGYGAAQGALTGIGMGESVEERAIGGLIGGATGGALGGAVQAASPYISDAATGVFDYARRKLGNRGSKAVENELKRLASESGKSVDEIVQGVADGTIMAENKTLLDAVRGYRAAGGEAATRLQSAMEGRPKMTRDRAMQEISQYLSDIDDPNILRAMSQTADEARIAEKAAYAPFKTQLASDDIVGEIKDAVKSVPEAAAALNKIYKSKTGEKPFVTIKKGVVEFANDLTVEQAEVVRRTLGDVASKEFKSGIGTVGEAVGEIERSLRTALDIDVKDLATTRQTASLTRSARDAFNDGQKAFAKSVDLVELELDKARKTGANVAKSYRAGFLQALKNRMKTGSMKSMMTNLADPDRKEGALLRILVPEDEIDGVLKSIERAATSQQAVTKIFGGSDTAVTASQQARQGSGINVSDIADAISGSPMAAMRIVGDVVREVSPKLSDADRLQIVNVLVSENPTLVRNALVDESGMAKLQAAIQRLAEAGTAGLQRGMTVGTPIAANQLGLLSQ